MRQLTRLAPVSALAIGLVGAQPGAAQQTSWPNLRLSTVGIGPRDYKQSLDFYARKMGFRSAFSFSPNGKTNNTYFQVSPESFLELQEGQPTPGFTHIHMQTDDVDAVVARLKKAAMAACSATVKTGCVGEPKMAQPTNEKNVLIVDPSGIRIEPTEFSPGSLTRKAVNSWDTKSAGTRLLVVGIGVENYAASQNFYEKQMGFRVAFKFTSPDGQRTTTYYQTSKDSFIEMQPAAAGVAPGITHVHLLTENLDTLIAKLKNAGLTLAPRSSTTPNTVTEAGIVMPSNVKGANAFDPDGNRLELNELLPESLTKRAMDAWK